MNRWMAMVLLSTLFFPAASPADIYRCVSKDGVQTFSDQPCGENAKVVAAETSLDQWIALSRPYYQSFFDPNCISKDLRSHSKLIGNSIVPKGQYSHRSVDVANEDRKIWKVTLAYKTEELQPWLIVLEYLKKSDSRGYGLWLTSISVFKWGEPFSPPDMKQITLMREIGQGKWTAPKP